MKPTLTRTRPRGYALVEMLVVMTMLAALLGLCGGMLHLLTRLDRAGRVVNDEASDLFRLARDFREDVHAARDPGPPAASTERFGFALGDGRSVEYAARPGDILRTVKQGDRVVARELYRRTKRASVAFAVDRPNGAPAMAVIRVGRFPEGKPDGPERVQEIVAEFARDRRRSGSAP